MDANRSPTVVLSSWDHFLLFHRVTPKRILISKIIPRDPNSPRLRSAQGQLWDSIETDWSPLKLLFALLLAAVRTTHLEGFAHPTTSHLVVSSSTQSSPSKRQRLPMSNQSPSSQPSPITGASLPSSSTGGTSILSDVLGDGFTVSLVSRHPLAGIPILMGTRSHQARCMNDFHPLFDLIPLDPSLRRRHDTRSRDWSTTSWNEIIHHFEVSRTHPTTHPRFGYPTPPSSPSSSLFQSAAEVRLGSYLSSGRLADTFTARLGPDSQPVVLKFVDLESFPVDSIDDESYDLSSATKAVCNEIKLYLTSLVPLQGTVVPKLYGVWLGHSPTRRAVVVIVLEDVGEGMAQDWESIPSAMRYVLSLVPLHKPLWPTRPSTAHISRPYALPYHPSSLSP